MQRSDLLQALDALLEPWRFKDYCPNGLQVEGRARVQRVVTGVTASAALIEAAIAVGADTVLVHHGYFWKNEDPRVIGMKKSRLARLLAHDINLIAYHLPLDAHPVLGNNAQLAAVLGLQVHGQTGEQNLLWYGELPEAISLDAWRQQAGDCLQRTPLTLGNPQALIRRVAWCTGGAQGMFADAVALGVDLFITGEASEPCAHIAAETGVAFAAAGHHATERYGVRAVGQHLADTLGIDVRWIDRDNPV